MLPRKSKREKRGSPFFPSSAKRDKHSCPFYFSFGERDKHRYPFLLRVAKRDNHKYPFLRSLAKRDKCDCPVLRCAGKRDNRENPFLRSSGKRENSENPFLICLGLIQIASGARGISGGTFRLRPRSLHPHEIRSRLPTARTHPNSTAVIGRTGPLPKASGALRHLNEPTESPLDRCSSASICGSIFCPPSSNFAALRLCARPLPQQRMKKILAQRGEGAKEELWHSERGIDECPT